MVELAGLATAPVEAAAGTAAGVTGGAVGSGAAGIGQLIQGIISGLAGLFSVGANIFNNERTNRTNTANVAATNQANIDLWREQSLYNSPVEQMKRLKMAGINPSLIYGQGGIENLAGAAPQMQASRNQAYYLDPLAAAQVANLNAQTQAIEHQTKREDEKQPMTMEQLQATMEETRARTAEILQQINNLKMDEQIASYDYLAKSLDYNFRQATFSDAVEAIHQGLLQSKLDYDVSKFGLDKALKQLSYEIIGWDLSNKAQRAAINLSLQEYRQNEALFDSIQRKYFWDSQNAWARYRQTTADVKLKESEKTLKDLSFWIEARDNPHAFKSYKQGDLFNEDELDKFMWECLEKMNRLTSSFNGSGLKFSPSFKIR